MCRIFTTKLCVECHHSMAQYNESRANEHDAITLKIWRGGGFDSVGSRSRAPRREKVPDVLRGGRAQRGIAWSIISWAEWTSEPHTDTGYWIGFIDLIIGLLTEYRLLAIAFAKLSCKLSSHAFYFDAASYSSFTFTYTLAASQINVPEIWTLVSQVGR